MSILDMTAKGAIGAALLIGAGVIGLNSYTTVPAGSVKTATLFGAIQDEVYTEGLHIVNPLYSFDKWQTVEQVYELNGISVPAKDKFKSSANITLKWSIDPNSTMTLRESVGVQKDVVHKIIRQPLLSLVREAGRSIEKSQDLFNEKTQRIVTEYIYEGMKEATEAYGIEIHAVYIQDITLPKVITDSIITTKKLEEQEAQESARLKQQSLVYQREEKKAESDAKAAYQAKLAAEHKADGEYYKAEKQADALLYTATKQAEANEKLGESITPELIQLKNIEVDMQRAKNWSGNVPQTVMGGDTNGVLPLYNIN